MKNMMKYKGYYGSVNYDEDDLVLYGKLEFIRSLVSYEGETVAGIKEAFEQAVNDYITMCEQENISPEKPFKGSFNIRIGEALHEKAVMSALKRDIKLNEFVKRAIEHEVQRA